MKLQREDIHPLQDTCPYFEWMYFISLMIAILKMATPSQPDYSVITPIFFTGILCRPGIMEKTTEASSKTKRPVAASNRPGMVPISGLFSTVP